MVPLAFARLGTPAQAGRFAAQLFAAQTWVALGCGLALLAILGSKVAKSPVDRAGTAIVLIAIALVLALLQQYAVAPHIVARENLRFWHAAGSVLYVAQWACAGLILWQRSR